MPPHLMHGSGRIAAKICKIGMGKRRRIGGSPNNTLVEVDSPQQHLSEVAGGVVRRGEGPRGSHKDKLGSSTSAGFSPSCVSVIRRVAERKSSLSVTLRHASSLIFAGKSRFRHSWSAWAKGRPRR